ncbi:MAG TPA: hypothetical protein PK435_12220, partial [Thermoanaerobaculaceae bacterium]|nr:hypothetical protein [Thermoanaerobaculaceae bacterium]
MDLFKGILHFLENNSVAAFFGAFSAFVLVVASERWRKRKRKNLFVQLVADTAGAADRRAQAVESVRRLLADSDTIQPGEFRRFPVADLNAMKLEVYDR